MAYQFPAATEAQAKFINDLCSQVLAIEVPNKKPRGCMDPAGAVRSKHAYANEVLAKLAAGEVTKGGASSYIDQLKYYIKY